jgi:hypothetical protein
MAIDIAHRRLFTGCRTGVPAVGNVPTLPRSRNMGLDPTHHRIFLLSAKFGEALPHHRPRVLPGTFSRLVVEPAAH